MAAEPIIRQASARAFLDQLDADLGTGALVRIYTGAAPATCETAASGTLLAEAAAGGGATLFDAATGTTTASIALSAAVSDTSAPAPGTNVAGYFRLWDSTATTCYFQGTVGATGSGDDLELASTSITQGDTVTISLLTISLPTGG
jgi:hypothetical protein